MPCQSTQLHWRHQWKGQIAITSMRQINSLTNETTMLTRGNDGIDTIQKTNSLTRRQNKLSVSLYVRLVRAIISSRSYSGTGTDPLAMGSNHPRSYPNISLLAISAKYRWMTQCEKRQCNDEYMSSGEGRHRDSRPLLGRQQCWWRNFKYSPMIGRKKIQ